jgi:O-antigen/teichoic acid export membrane protein
MTRLLVPEMFGVMAIATMVTVILGLLSDVGLHQNIVQSRRGNDLVFLDTVWSVQIVRGFVLWLIATLVSAALYFANLSGLLPADSVYASPVLPLVIAVSSLSAIILGFQSTRMAIADRDFNQKRLAQVGLISQVAALAIMVFIGTATRSIWALVAGGLVTSLITTILSHTWMRGQPNRFRFEKRALRELTEFGKWVFVSSAVGVFATNGDRLLLGSLVDAHVLGLYAIAGFIIGAIWGAVQRLFETVSLPALSEIARDDPSRMREVYYRLRLPGDLLLLFVTGLLFAAGQLVIDLLYDPRYSEAGGFLQILSLSLFTIRYGVAIQLYVALGVTRYVAIVNVVRFLSLYTLVPALYYLAGTQAVIWGVALHGLAMVPFIYAFNAKLGLIDWRRELMVLVVLPIGFLSGSALNQLLAR